MIKALNFTKHRMGISSKYFSKVYTPRRISIEEIKKHDTIDDSWVVINKKVYDATEFWSSHPGGIEFLVKSAVNDRFDMISFYEILRKYEDDMKFLGEIEKNRIINFFNRLKFNI